MRPDFDRPRAITMWDFSWLERRWPGAGYEDVEQALDELAERGYDAVRIDAYPHLVSAGPERTWKLLPQWSQNTWGAQSTVWVQVMPALQQFMDAARRRQIGVGLSTWFREDADQTRMRITSPEDHAGMWIDTLHLLEDADVLDAVLYVDLCNEFPLPPWVPFLYRDQPPPDPTDPDPLAGIRSRTEPELQDWMDTSIGLVRRAYPDLDYTYSFTTELDSWAEQDVSSLDVLEPHIWMATAGDYYPKVGYDFQPFDPIGYDNLVANARRVYEEDAAAWDAGLFAAVDTCAAWSRATGKALYTTECWSLVDWKDWPGLDWDWIKDLTARGLRHAASTGRWVGLATSNFCGPQFVGMWRDVAWHQQLTTLIKNSAVDSDLRR